MSEAKTDNLVGVLPRGRGHVLAGIALAIAAGVGFWPLSLHPADLLVGPQGDGLNDLTRQFLLAREQQGEALTRGDVSAAWNPLILAGAPRFGNPQSGLLYPPNWLYALIPAQFLISWMLVVHHGWAGWGTYLLCRQYGLRWSASILAGLCFLSAPYLLAHTSEGHYPQVCVVAWTPFAFLAVERLRGHQRGGVALTAAVLALAFFCGHLQELFYLVLLLTAFLTPDFAGWLRRTRDGSSPPQTGRHPPVPLAGRWLLTGLAVAGLTAVELLPMWAYSRQSIRYAGVGLEQLRQGTLGWANLWQLLDPFALGTATNYTGTGRFCETLCCFGVVTLVLAGAGVAARRRGPFRRLAVLFVAAFVFAFGAQTPWYPLLERWVPGVSLFRCPSRILFFCSFFAAVLAGAGFDRLLSLSGNGRRRCRRGLWALSSLMVCLAIGLLCWRWLGPAAPGNQTMPATGTPWAMIPDHVQWWMLLGTLAGTVAAMWLLATTDRGSRWAMVLVLGLVSLEFVWHSGRMLRTIPPSAAGRENPLLEFLRPRVGSGRVLVGQALLSDREAWWSRIPKLQGYEPVPSARLALYAAALTGPQNSDRILLGFESPRLSRLQKPLADALGVRYAVVPGKDLPEVPGWRRVGGGSLPQEFTLRGQSPSVSHFTVYQNDSPAPRAFLIGRVQLRERSSDIVRQLARMDPRREVLLDRDVLPPGPRQSFTAAEMVADGSERIQIQATLTAPGYLVLSDAYYPGWSAWVDDRPAPLLPANLAFRAVPLDRGRHRIEFRYEPPRWKTGAWLSALTVVALLIGSRLGRWGQVNLPGRGVQGSCPAGQTCELPSHE